MSQGNEDVGRLLTSGACHLLNYALSVVVKRRSEHPVEDMAEILREGLVRFTAEELLQFFRDVRQDTNSTLPYMLEAVLVHSSPEALDPNDPLFASYLETATLAVSKLDETTLSSPDTMYSSPLLTLASTMYLGRRELAHYSASAGCHLQFVIHADPVLFTAGDALSLLVRQMYWLFDESPAWTWSLDFVCFSPEEKKRASLVLMQRGGGDRVRVTEAPLQFSRATENHYVVLLDASHCVHVAVVGGLVTELLTDKSISGIFVRNTGEVLGKQATTPGTARKNSMKKNGGPNLVTAKQLLQQQSMLQNVAAINFSASRESDVVVSLLKKLTASNHLDSIGDCWSRLAVYRGSALRQLTQTCAFKSKRCMHIEIAVRVVALQEKEKVGEKKKQCILAQREVALLPPMQGFCHEATGGTPTPTLAYEEWLGIASSVSADNKKSAVFSKYYPIFATQVAFDAHINATMASFDAP